MKALIVDDDPFIVEMYSLKLKEAGYDIQAAPDGKRGLEEIRHGGWDVILLDVVLPMMDGFEVLETIQREKIVHPPIILLTNLGQKEDIDRGLALGAVDYLIKAHFTPKEVVEKVDAAVAVKR